MERVIIIHYSELGLKRGHFAYFKGKLKVDLAGKLKARFGVEHKILHTLKRFMVFLPEGFVESEYVEVLSRVLGVKNFKFCYVGSLDFEKLSDEIMEELGNDEAETFCVRVKRSMKMDIGSSDSERMIGGFLLKREIGKKVKLRGSDLVVDIEFFNERAYFSFKTYKGVAGLPGDSQGKILGLLSSGIDSPVAIYRMMKRGARLMAVHFSGYPYTDKEERNQVEDLCEVLRGYQADFKLIVVEFGEFQKMVGMCEAIDSRYNTLLYRRMMMRVAEKLAERNGCGALVTGDSLGQVASQTLANLKLVHSVTKLPLFQPLIGYDKEEVIAISKEIGAFEISKLPCKDSCTLFVGESAEVSGSIAVVEQFEKEFDVDAWVDRLVSAA